MAIRKFRLFLASGVEKEERWLTDMSAKGLHMEKSRLGFYTFEEDESKSYVYQIDFQQGANEDYFQVFKDLGWEPVTGWADMFQYFRTEASQEGIKKIYSDRESVMESYKRMMRVYLFLFFMLILTQLPIWLTWDGHFYQVVVITLSTLVILLYIYMLIALKSKINLYWRN
ncbi:DUF2812 domain-containing protein [Virgibacillus sp. NKC19-16]|uniref:DUF2812 domain-containing protein n=1 Tax=Virgibacillus salidurans TaxID=2831673 RepID=UPI001F3DA533|nr:DUF2812 domain-containing protein [Virgibacillus sp. NKC19-16]UJL46441.1 DUF2812 domain-containing protein [Virgibacillus sp. NKC19-16]